MRTDESDIPQICPSCGAPRLEHAWDCAKCGAVFDDGAPPAAGEPPADAAGSSDDAPRPAAAPRKPRSSSAKRPGSTPRRSSSGSTQSGLTALRGWVADNKAAAIIISFVFYVVSIWVFGALIIGGTDSPGAVKSAYRDITGRPVPKGFGPAFAAHFVSRRMVAFNRPDQVFMILYRDEDGTTDEGLRRFAEGFLEMIELPYEQVRLRTIDTEEGVFEVPVLQLLGEGGPHLYLIPTSTTDGERAVEAVFGEPKAVLEVVHAMVEYR